MATFRNHREKQSLILDEDSKNKINDHSSTIQHRLKTLQMKIVILSQMNTNKTYNYHNESNSEQFEYNLSNSATFRDYLQKADNNNTANLSLLQNHFQNRLDQLLHKFGCFEQKILSLMMQKDKIFEHLSYQIQNQQVSLNGVQQWIKISQIQTSSLKIYEQNMKNRMELLKDNLQNKIQTFHIVNQNKISKNETIIKDLKNKIQSISQDWKEAKNKMPENKASLKFAQSKKNNNEKQFDQFKEKLEELQSQISHHNKETTNQLKTYSKKIKELELKISTLQNKIYEKNNNSQQHQTVQPRIYGTANKQKSQNSDKKFTPNKLVPQYKPNQPTYKLQSQSEEQLPDPSQMRGGIRGLLQKSKQKSTALAQKFDSAPQKSGLSPLKKPLPPKKDPLPPMRGNQLHMQPKSNQRILHEESQDSQEQGYEIDSEGYLIKHDGEYQVNQYGQRIKLSESQIKQLLNQEQNH